MLGKRKFFIGLFKILSPTLSVALSFISSMCRGFNLRVELPTSPIKDTCFNVQKQPKFAKIDTTFEEISIFPCTQ